ncbi:hypothetical protein [Streptomyces sp. CB01635]|uniref:hypothetical protein n=1 Tax=Streptomyces sp. CB01635 TaxID=2020326 RepID=UPI00131DEDA8
MRRTRGRYRRRPDRRLPLRGVRPGLDDHYAAQARTLTANAEASLLKFAELLGTLAPQQAACWAELRAAHARARTLGGADGDPVVRAVAALGPLTGRIAAGESEITRVTDPPCVGNHCHSQCSAAAVDVPQSGGEGRPGSAP